MGDLEFSSAPARLRNALQNAIPKAFKAQEFASIAPLLADIRAGNWQEFDKMPMKVRQFAALALIIDSWWTTEVARFRADHSDVSGLCAPSATTGVARALSVGEFALLQDRKTNLRNRMSVACDCMMVTLSLTARQLSKRLATPGKELIVHGRDVFQTYLNLLNEELSGAGGMPQALERVLAGGIENAVKICWILPASIVKQVAGPVATSHGAAFAFFRSALNDLAATDSFSAEQLTAGIRRAAKDRTVQDESLERLREIKLTGNTSYTPPTPGCPAFYTKAFDGLIQWVGEVKANMLVSD